MTSPAAESSTARTASSWQRALASMLDDDAPALDVEDTEHPGPAIGLEFDLQLPTFRRVHRARQAQAGAPYSLGMRPVRKGRRGDWIRGGLDWEKVTEAGISGMLTAEQADWFDEIRSLANVRSRQVLHDRHWVYVEHYESPVLWSLLGRAEELGVEFITRDHAQPVRLSSPGRFQIDLVHDDENNLLLHPEVLIDTTNSSQDATADDAARVETVALESAGIVGAPGHGVFFPAPQDPVELERTEDLNRFPLTLVPLRTRLTRDQRQFLETAQEVTVPHEEIQEFLDHWFPRLHQRIGLANDDGSIELPHVAPPEMVLTVHHDDLTIRLDWEWEYSQGGQRIRLPFRPADPSGTEPAKRESTWESAMTKAVMRRIPDLEFRRSAYVGYEAVVLLRDWLPELEKVHDLRIQVTGTEPAYKPSDEPPEITVSTLPSEHRDWFDLGVTVRVGDFYVAFAEIFRALARGQDVMMLPNGSWFALDAPRFEHLRELLREARSLQETPSDQLRVSKHQMGLWQELEELSDRSETVTQWREAVNRLVHREPSDPPPVPAGLTAQLRPYQVEGFQWLAALQDMGLGGILADDMGLGKTVQVIALFTHVLEQAQLRGPENPAVQPFLVVAPTSVVPNWVSEINKFAPHLKIAAAQGTAAGAGQMPAELAATQDVVVTSYTLLRMDEALWSQPEWEAVILDEAQFVKNPRTQAHRVARELKTRTTVAVTGTPLENGLADLWALLSLSAPGLFPSRRKFVEDYQRPIEVSHDRAAMSRMRRRIAPFILRRTKDAVDLQLPPKLEQTLRIQLTEEHRKLYDLHLQRERSKVLKLLPELNRNRFTIFSSLTKLRLMALDPSLVDPELEISSSKLEALFEHLPEIVAEGHRPLVFSQFTGFLKLAAARLDRLGIPYAYLDGSTRDRGAVIQRFRDGQAPVFLISLKAGGTGLNLTEADYCFLLDPWWNPMAENQAVDRAHRIGQERKVMVYRMVATGTIEEKVMELKDRKARLFETVMDDDGTFSAALTEQDVMELFRQ
ncbi:MULTISPECIES: DEAD/DEAH box helicase [Kocuria]|uniref:DEAD/DEAH box helicase n=1 Tax=Kocuria subflava TaxID=1736139 RepID=A0A846TQD8_9MICC|nr:MULTISPECIES: DEAD/DEAH box helicase [Kocuria]NKE09039.1 DEAD/DEAH box helicase [Kocuria subflava]